MHRIAVNAVLARRRKHGAFDPLQLITVSGDLHARVDTAHTIRLRSTSGDLHLEGILAKDGSLEAESVSGALQVRAAPETGYDYEMSSFSGDISNCFNGPIERTSQYGPGHHASGSRGASGGAKVRLKTMSGDIELCDRL